MSEKSITLHVNINKGVWDDAIQAYCKIQGVKPTQIKTEDLIEFIMMVFIEKVNQEENREKMKLSQIEVAEDGVDGHD